MAAATRCWQADLMDVPTTTEAESFYPAANAQHAWVEPPATSLGAGQNLLGPGGTINACLKTGPAAPKPLWATAGGHLPAAANGIAAPFDFCGIRPPPAKDWFGLTWEFRFERCSWGRRFLFVLAGAGVGICRPGNFFFFFSGAMPSLPRYGADSAAPANPTPAIPVSRATEPEKPNRRDTQPVPSPATVLRAVPSETTSPTSVSPLP